MSDDQQQQEQPKPENKIIQMVEVPDPKPPKGVDSMFTVQKSENPTDTRDNRKLNDNK